MNAVLAIVSANVRLRRRASTALLLVVLTLASAGVSASLVARTHAADLLDARFEATQGPHLVVYSGSDTAEVEEFLQARGELTPIAGPIPSLFEGVDYAPRQRTTARILAYDANAPWAIANPLLRSGRWASAGGEIVIDHSFAVAHGLRTGSTVGLANANRKMTVVGTALDFSDCYVPDCDPFRAWITPPDYTSIDAPKGSVFFARTSSPLAIPAVEAALNERFGQQVGSNSWPDTRDDILARDNAFGTFLRAFGLFVLLASSFIVASALTARAVARRREIGLLKALGFSPRQIMAGVLTEHLLLGTIAAVTGWLLAGILTSRLRVGVVRLLEGTTISLPARSLGVTLFLTALSLLVAVTIPAIRWGRSAAVGALRDTPPGAVKTSRVARQLERLHAPLPSVLGARDLAARPSRTALTIGAVAVTVVVAVSSIGLIGSMTRLQDNPRLGGTPADAQAAIPDGLAAERFGAQLATLPEVGGWFTDVPVKSSIDGRPFLARVMGGDPAAVQLVVREGRPLRAAGEAIVGWGFLHEMGVRVGDTVPVVVGTEAVDLTIVGWYSETEDSGVVLRVREESLSAAARPAAFDVRLVAAGGVSRRALADAVMARYDVRVGTFEPDDDLAEFISATRIMALLIAVVAVAHVASSLVTTARERSRDIGVLRSIGFTDRQLTAQCAAAALFIAVAALAIGLPLGWQTQFLLGDTLSREVGAGPGLTVGPAVRDVALAAAAVLGAAAGLGALSARGVLRQKSSNLVRAVD